jgi:hypothetical protein
MPRYFIPAGISVSGLGNANAASAIILRWAAFPVGTRVFLVTLSPVGRDCGCTKRPAGVVGFRTLPAAPLHCAKQPTGRILVEPRRSRPRSQEEPAGRGRRYISAQAPHRKPGQDVCGYGTPIAETPDPAVARTSPTASTRRKRGAKKTSGRPEVMWRLPCRSLLPRIVTHNILQYDFEKKQTGFAGVRSLCMSAASCRSRFGDDGP